jgi:Putative serine esterase (DUF676)
MEGAPQSRKSHGKRVQATASTTNIRCGRGDDASFQKTGPNMVNRPDLPPSGVNNLWYVSNDSTSVVVFVHGILSDSRSCWLAKGENRVYWPQLVSEDERLPHPSIFLGGFYTAVDAGKFDIADCAKELFNGLTTPDGQRRSPPIDKKRLVFICHSTGGIIVRHMLLNNIDRFRDKQIGLGRVDNLDVGVVN